jgi:hypothetical protein
VAVESTGVYWKPVFNLIEGTLEVVLVNARHAKAVPGRRTDVRDCEWLADLLRHGLLRPSFIPPPGIRELRELTRYRQVAVGHSILVIAYHILRQRAGYSGLTPMLNFHSRTSTTSGARPARTSGRAPDDRRTRPRPQGRPEAQEVSRHAGGRG